MKPIETIMRTAPVIPVLVIEDAAYARPIAEALVAGGLRVLEVTLRTAAGLDAIAEMRKVPGAKVAHCQRRQARTGRGVSGKGQGMAVAAQVSRIGHDVIGR